MNQLLNITSTDVIMSFVVYFSVVSFAIFLVIMIHYFTFKNNDTLLLPELDIFFYGMFVFNPPALTHVLVSSFIFLLHLSELKKKHNDLYFQLVINHNKLLKGYMDDDSFHKVYSEIVDISKIS